MTQLEHDMETGVQHVGKTIEHGTELAAIAVALSLKKPKPKVFIEPEAQEQNNQFLEHTGHDLAFINYQRGQGVSDEQIVTQLREKSLSYQEAQHNHNTGDQYLQGVMQHAHRSPQGQLPSLALQRSQATRKHRARSGHG